MDLGPRVASLTSVSWEEVGTRISLPAWRRFVKPASHRLSGMTPASLPTLDWAALGGPSASARASPPPIWVISPVETSRVLA